ncbi:Uncharacterised protein (plasmid) [Tsukamurella tyrosinosolvens]|uniref:Uncharacterized protein n=1 Tax=Tsukamurella tyrosinosolvens TaxID=57704 RepID=A0A1H4VFM5_TSUTY|nr:hypothetical protein [Tsukamurella tyrosinosolvens]KXO91001.1 hypothetical protein AXK58_21460 [Tsukamurella tyrosinosolvens]SEC79174.1 hypothetical protein SAMN04489793_3201 [Tsukamurella tyrosinosolvens]VEH90572.1 Uncharacterised protein [Tsukamurella tyrosinosolvens]
MSTTYDVLFHHEVRKVTGKHVTFIGSAKGFIDELEAQEFMRSMFGKRAYQLRMNDKERELVDPDLDPDMVITCATIVMLENGYERDGTSPKHYYT